MDAILDVVLARDEESIEKLVIEANLELCDWEFIQFDLKGWGKKQLSL